MSITWPLFPKPETTEVELCGHTIYVAAIAVPAFELVDARARRSEYGVWLAETDSFTPTGAFNYRNRRPYPETPVTVERHSEHAHGVAVDVNYDDNPLRTDGVLVSDFDRFGWEDGCDWLACWLEPPPDLPVFFRWGGGWTSDLEQAGLNLRHNGERIRTGVVDGMHLELVLTPAEVRAYDWDKAIAEEVAMNKQLEALVAQSAGIKRATTFVDGVLEELRPGKEDATPAGGAHRVAETILEAEKARG